MYNWLYTSWNDNEYILFLIIVILFFIIIDFGLLHLKKAKKVQKDKDNNKKARFFNITNPNSTNATNATNATTATTATNTNQANNNTTTTMYQAPTASNPSNNLFISPEEKRKMGIMWAKLDGDEESIPVNRDKDIKNDILQLDSTLYEPRTSNSASIMSANYDKQNSWATIDELGKSMTDTLGGINSNLGYTVIQEQLGTFKPNYNNPNTYDNTLSYKTGLNSDNLSGVATQGVGSDYKLLNKNGTPIIMQKDFAGVANIFAPNIYIANSPLKDDGFPNISYTV